MKSLLASIATIVLFACQPVAAQMYAKPVSCGDMKELIPEWEKDDMYPLVGLGGMSPTENPGKYKNSVTVLIVNDDGKWALFEYSGSQFCLLSGGYVIEYNSNKIKDIMDWD